jgi:TetR/AcrR family transcriptional regulator, regulator of autoinduction and epiphytic fitness
MSDFLAAVSGTAAGASAGVEAGEVVDARVERSHRVIRAAAVAQLAAGGWGAFTIEAVAARAGVARSTVYRHWPDKVTLLVDALEHHSVQPPEGTVAGRDRVVELVHHLAEAMADPQRSALVPALAETAEHDPEVRQVSRRFSAARRAALVSALGEVGVADAELASLALSGAVFYARFMGEAPLDPARADDLVTAVLGPAP